MNPLLNLLGAVTVTVIIAMGWASPAWPGTAAALAAFILMGR